LYLTEKQNKNRERPVGKGFFFAMSEAAHCGYLELIKWLHERGLSHRRTMVFICAAIRGHLGVMKWLHKHATGTDALISGDDDTMRVAAFHGHFAVVQWLYENFKDDVRVAPAMAGAARSGYIEKLRV